MSMDGCLYCDRGERLQSLMYFICEVDGFPLYLNRNQTHRGRVILACNHHVATVAELTPQEATSFFAAVHRVTRALTKVYHPDQVNIGMYGDMVTHVHCHIVPKYKGDTDWNSVFQMSPQPPVCLDAEQIDLAAKAIATALL